MVRLHGTFGNNRELLLSTLRYCVDVMVVPFLVLHVMISPEFHTIWLVDRLVRTT